MALLLIALGVLALFAFGPSSPQKRAGLLVAVALLLLVVLGTRLGARALVFAGPVLAWAAAQLLQHHLRARKSADPAPKPAHGGMTREEALRVLGLKEGASREAIAAAHRHLVKRLHPDQGGSGYLTQQVNEARKLLESEL